MAVTQQLAILPDAVIDECRSRIETRESLISFKLLGSEDYLDLDWAPEGLKGYLRAAKQSDSIVAGLATLLEGQRPIDAEQPSLVGEYWLDVPLTYASSEEVREAYDSLKAIDWQAVEDSMRQALGSLAAAGAVELDCEPVDYYMPMLRDLLEFTERAVLRRYGMVQWWD